jgi:hypothetical protein
MGMFTEIYINCPFKKNIPNDVINILKYMFDDSENEKKPTELPDHQFFSLDYWEDIGKSDSYYGTPFTRSIFRFDDISKKYYLTYRSDLKNYDNEIDNFFDWIMPYVDARPGQFIGYKRYETDNSTTLFFKVQDYARSLYSVDILRV